MISLLLASGGEIEWMDEQKCTPLHLACKRGHLESVALLLTHGANIYAKDFRQWTPLHYASYNGFRRVCNYLLKWEADRDVLRGMKNSQGKIALNIAKNPEVKKGFAHVWRACRDGDLDLVRVLVREGQHLDEQTQAAKNSPLHIAARHGHFLVVKYLVEAGANPALANKDGLTPFDFAEEAKKELELRLAGAKHRIGGPGFDTDQAAATIDDLNAIMHLIAKTQQQ